MDRMWLYREFRRFAMAASLCALAWPLASPAQQGLSDIAELQLSAQATPGAMVRGYGTFRWIVDTASNGVWAFNHSGHFAQLPAGAIPTEIALWKGKGFVVTEPGIGKIALVKYKSGSLDVESITQISIPGFTTTSPGTLWAAADGNIYISTGNGGIVQVTPSLQVNSGTITPPGNSSAKVANALWTIPTPSGAAVPPSALNFTDGADGNIWFTETFALDAKGNPIINGQEKIGRITPAGVVTEFAIPSQYPSTGTHDKTTGTSITLGSDGNVWFKESGTGKLGRITPAGVVTEFALPAAATILGIVAGPDGNLWVKAYNGKIHRVTPSGTVTTFSIPTASLGRDVELVPGPDGAIWFVEDSKIGRITTAGVITEFSLPTPTVNGTPIYPFQLAFAPDGTGTFLEYTTNAVATFTVPPSPSGTISVVEFYNAALDHYFLSTDANEISDLDTGVHVGWTRTSLAFNAYPAGHAGASPVCRFYIPPALGDSHFFGRGTAECNATAQKNPTFDYESPEVMDMLLPTAGACPAGTIPVYRVFSNRSDANHRYTTVRSIRDQMVTRGWLAEGDGPDLVVMCAPQ